MQKLESNGNGPRGRVTTELCQVGMNLTLKR